MKRIIAKRNRGGGLEERERKERRQKGNMKRGEEIGD